MSRYRTIHCLVWNDDKFPFCSDEIRLVWFHLKTTPFSTPLGIFKAPIEGLAAEIRWPIERYQETLREGLAKGFWNVDERFHVVYFPHYFRYNKPENPNVLKGWLKHWDEIPQCDLKAECYQQLRAHCEIWGKPYLNVLETFRKRLTNVPETGTVTGTVTVTVTGTGLKTTTGAPPPARPIPSVEAFQLAEQLRATIAVRDPNAKAGKTDDVGAWAHDIDLLLRLDKRKPDEVRAVIAWCQSPGNFWGPNILSGRKLREKFDTLIGQMTRDNGAKNAVLSGNREPDRRPFAGAPAYVPTSK